MGLIVTDEAIIIYDALKTTFDVDTIGGGVTQKKNTITGEFEVDRQLCPLQLVPSLQVTDPNTGTSGDKSGMITGGWYKVTASTGAETEITSTSDSDAYYKAGNTLVVQQNVEPGTQVILRFKGSYVNPHTLQAMPLTRDMVLSTEAFVEFSPAIEVDAANLLTVSPFKLTDSDHKRVVTARFLAGTVDISDNANVVYKWEKLEGGTYRDIKATDVEVLSVVGRRMTLDLRCVRLSKFRVTAWHTGYADAGNRRSYLFTASRQMPGYAMACRVTSGKYLKIDTPRSEAEAVLTVNSNQMDDPSEFFRCKFGFYLQTGAAKGTVTNLGYGNTASVGRDKSGYDKTKTPTFQMEYAPLSEHQLLTDDSPGGSGYITDDSGSATASENGGYCVGQIVES